MFAVIKSDSTGANSILKAVRVPTVRIKLGQEAISIREHGMLELGKYSYRLQIKLRTL